MPNPEEQARQQVDRLLAAAGWAVQDFKAADLAAARGVALREFELNPSHSTADYLLYVDGKAAGIVEAKKQGATLTGVEVQSGRYAQGLPATLPAWRRPLPFLYESTGLETHFINALDPEPRARAVFAFDRPETLADWLGRGSGRSVVLAKAGTQRLSDAVAPAPDSSPRGRLRPGPNLQFKKPPPPTTSELSSTASATCPRWSPNGPTSSSGPPRSPPSATWKPASRRTSRARSFKWLPAAARPSPPSASSTG